jgi:hypothetical protein
VCAVEFDDEPSTNAAKLFTPHSGEQGEHMGGIRKLPEEATLEVGHATIHSDDRIGDFDYRR